MTTYETAQAIEEAEAIMCAAASKSTARCVAIALDPVFGLKGLSLDERHILEWDIATQAGQALIRLDDTEYDFEEAQRFAQATHDYLTDLYRRTWGTTRQEAEHDIVQTMALALLPTYLGNPARFNELTFWNGTEG